LNVRIDEASLVDCGTREAADLHAGQRADREMGRLFINRVGGQEISGQQEFQDLPAALRKLKVSVRPSGTQNEYVVGRFASRDYSFSRIGYREMRPIVIGLRV